MKRSRGLVLAAALALACDRHPSAPDPPPPLVISVPATLGEPLPFPERNPLTIPGVALGKRLFFDPGLSGNGQVACASCHDPALAFSDGKPKSNGVSGKPLLRHSPALVNLAWMNGYFWDGGASDLESQVYGPLTSPDEMAQSPSRLVKQLAADPTYVADFGKAFPDGLTMANLARALAQYERTLISAESRYDRAARGEPGAALTDLERTGLALVQARCSPCHATGFFTDFDYHNNGLDDHYSDADERIAWGRGRITRKASDIGKYKTPTLRNVVRTAPYMHDGRFETLTQVLEHYRSGIRPSPTLDPILSGDGKIPLADADVAAILAFLDTLTDLPPAAPR